MDKDVPSFQWFQEVVVCITIYPITVPEVNNEKDTRSQLTWLLPETVESTPKRHLGVLDLALLSSSHLWKTADNLRMTVQLPLQLGVVIWLVFRSEWEPWSLPHQDVTFKKWEIAGNGRDNFQGVPSVTRKGVTYLLKCDRNTSSLWILQVFFFLLQELTLHQLLLHNKELLKEIYEHYPPHEKKQVFSSTFIEIYKGIDV